MNTLKDKRTIIKTVNMCSGEALKISYSETEDGDTEYYATNENRPWLEQCYRAEDNDFNYYNYWITDKQEEILNSNPKLLKTLVDVFEDRQRGQWDYTCYYPNITVLRSGNIQIDYKG